MRRPLEPFMSLTLLLLIQASAPAPVVPGVSGIDFDLGRYVPSDVDALTGRRRCDRSAPDAITVCAPRQGATYPLAEMARLFAARPIRAETQLAPGVVGDLHVEAGPTSDRGVTPNRAMARVRIPF